MSLFDATPFFIPTFFHFIKTLFSEQINSPFFSNSIPMFKQHITVKNLMFSLIVYVRKETLKKILMFLSAFLFFFFRHGVSVHPIKLVITFSYKANLPSYKIAFCLGNVFLSFSLHVRNLRKIMITHYIRSVYSPKGLPYYAKRIQLNVIVLKHLVQLTRKWTLLSFRRVERVESLSLPWSFNFQVHFLYSFILPTVTSWLSSYCTYSNRVAFPIQLKRKIMLSRYHLSSIQGRLITKLTLSPSGSIV